jgi:hypothetical protein
VACLRVTADIAAMNRNRTTALTVLALLLAGGCHESSTSPPEQAAFARYVAIGTSLSMGVQSDGVVYFSQEQAWTKLLAHQAFASLTQPLVQAPGCFSPLAGPLYLGTRLSGISVSADQTTSVSDTTCALLGTIVLPANDVAIDGANTYDALFITPESASVEGVKRRRQYHLVLPPKRSQIGAMMQQAPSLVSVELGGNEILGALSGLIIAKGGYRDALSQGTIVPTAIWQPIYDQVVDSVKKTGAKVLLVGLPGTNGLVSLRTGDELYQDRSAFLDFGVTIAADCAGSPNLIFVPSKVGAVITTAQAAGQPQTLSCADQAGAQDNVLTPEDITTLDALIASMNDHIKSTAQANGWAYLDLASVWAQWVTRRPPFSVEDFLNCVLPFGQYVSLDGIHPNIAGYQEMANAAADALNATYGFTIPINPLPVLSKTCS